MPKLVGKIQNNDDIVNKKYVDDRTVVDSALSSTSTNPVQNKIINSALAGKASSAHTHSTKDLWIPTDAVQNGGPGTVDRFGLAETRACKTAFLPPEAITIEYTTDGGTTWTNYGATDTQKQELVACRYSGSFKYGGPSCTTVTNQIGLRITLNPTDRYCYVNMAYLWVNSVAHTCMVSLERSTIGAKTTFSPVNNGKQYQITGWTGGNMLYFPGSTFGGGSTQYSNTYAYRFTFLCTAVNTDWINSVPSIIDLRMYGTSTWTAPNEMMKTDHLYSWDRNKNATFPAAVTATNFIGTINGYSIAKSVPANAVFTDTTYNNATTSVAGLMSSTDKTKLDGIANGATANIGTITGITMNGTSKGTSGVVDLGTVITAHQDIVYLIDTGSDISTFTNSGTYLIDATLNMSYTYMFGPSGSQIRVTSLIPLYKGDILFCSMDSTYIYWTIYAYSDNKKWIVKCTKSTGYSTGNYSTLLDTAGGDNLPVGTEVDYYGNVSDIPEGWQVTSESGEFLLYSGDSNGTITLSDNASNYEYIEIFFRTNDNVYDSTKVYQPNNKLVSLAAWWANANVPRFYTKVKIVTINGTSIQAVSSNQYGEVSYDTSSDPVYISNSNNIYITRVIGYKNRV